MRNDSIDALAVNREVRRILVAHWIDLGRLSVRTVASAVFVRGFLQKLPGADSDLSPAVVDAIHGKIKAAAGSRHVHMELENWLLNTATGTWDTADARERKRTAVGKFADRAESSAYHVEEQ